MTSKSASSECFVYITLPYETEAVTAGRFVHTVNRSGQSVGTFVYGKSYLVRKDALEIDPVDLKLRSQLFETTSMNGIFSSLRDAGPDSWGRRLIERRSGRPSLREIDYLLESPDDRAGALGFGLNQTPPAPVRRFNKTINLERLQLTAEKIVQEQLTAADDETIQVNELLLLGTSLGGARPKAVVEDKTGLWVAKFGRSDDRWNHARVEHAMLELARRCGINSARNRVERVGDRDVLLVQRFDRERSARGFHRARMISGLTLLRAEESPTNRGRWSYILLAEELRRVVEEPKQDCVELFRRMCFNALISNSDDHPRNHAVVAFDRSWRLSPAYDLLPSLAVSQERRDLAMDCGDRGRIANANNLLSQCSRFLLTRDEAETIVATMSAEIRANWEKVARAHGVNSRDVELTRGAFVYDGFNRE